MLTKSLLALIVLYTASQLAFDSLSQQRAIYQHSPEIRMCYFKPIQTYGVMLKMHGFYEISGCCALKGNLKNCMDKFFHDSF